MRLVFPTPLSPTKHIRIYITVVYNKLHYLYSFWKQTSEERGLSCTLGSLMTRFSTFIAHNRVGTFASDMTRLLALVTDRIILTLSSLMTRLFTATANNFVLTVTSKMTRLKAVIANIIRNESSLTILTTISGINRITT